MGMCPTELVDVPIRPREAIPARAGGSRACRPIKVRRWLVKSPWRSAMTRMRESRLHREDIKTREENVSYATDAIFCVLVVKPFITSLQHACGPGRANLVRFGDCYLSPGFFSGCACGGGACGRGGSTRGGGGRGCSTRGGGAVGRGGARSSNRAGGGASRCRGSTGRASGV